MNKRYESSRANLKAPKREQTTLDEQLCRRLVGFTRFARDHHFAVGIQEEIDALKLAVSVGILDKSLLRNGLRALLCSSTADWQRFDTLFDSFWQRPDQARGLKESVVMKQRAGQEAPGNRPGPIIFPSTNGESEKPGDRTAHGTSMGQSAKESCATTDFRELSDTSDQAQMEILVEQMARRMRRRLLRRQMHHNKGFVISIRRTLRRSLRYGGLPLSLVFRKRRRRLPKLVLLLDVSRSMSVYSMLFLRFARGILNVFQSAEAYAFHTRLLNISDTLREPNSKRLSDKLALISAGWHGGTRIGESLASFNKNYARRVLNSRSIAVVISDGYETGDPDRLSKELTCIKQRVSRLIWLNPLLGRKDYEPCAQGMRAALPLLDLFLPAHNLASLRALEVHLAKI